MRLRLVTATCLLALLGCRPNHIRPHTPRQRSFDPGKYDDAYRPLSEGSLWSEGTRGLFADFRAGRVGDLVTIRIDEAASAQGDASTQTQRESSLGIGMPKLFGFTAALQRTYPDLDSTKLIDLMSESEFDGSGSTQRGTRVRADIGVRVKRVLPNGDLYVEGSKVLLINEEELHIYVSGVIRQQDIREDNSVSSGLIAEAQIELTGRGVLSDNQQRGWLTRLLAAINPF